VFQLKAGLVGLVLWLKLVILATQEAETGRIAVGSQPGQKIHETAISTMIGRSGENLFSQLYGEAQIDYSQSRLS
jgi:hypothetical protein